MRTRLVLTHQAAETDHIRMQNGSEFPVSSSSCVGAAQGPFTLPTGTIAKKAGLDGVKEVLITERLCKELYGTALHRLHDHRHIGMRCDEDDREFPFCRGEFAL